MFSEILAVSFSFPLRPRARHFGPKKKNRVIFFFSGTRILVYFFVFLLFCFLCFGIASKFAVISLLLPHRYRWVLDRYIAGDIGGEFLREVKLGFGVLSQPSLCGQFGPP